MSNLRFQNVVVISDDPGNDRIAGNNSLDTPVFHELMNEYNRIEDDRAFTAEYIDMVVNTPPKPPSLWATLFGTKRKQRVRI